MWGVNSHGIRCHRERDTSAWYPEGHQHIGTLRHLFPRISQPHNLSCVFLFHVSLDSIQERKSDCLWSGWMHWWETISLATEGRGKSSPTFFTIPPLTPGGDARGHTERLRSAGPRWSRYGAQTTTNGRNQRGRKLLKLNNGYKRACPLKF